MLLEWGSVPPLRALLGGPEWWDEPCIWSQKLLIRDPRLPPFDLRHLKNSFMPYSLFMRWRGQKGPLQPHGLNWEASGACLEGRVRLSGWGSLPAAPWAELQLRSGHGAWHQMEEAQPCDLQSLLLLPLLCPGEAECEFGDSCLCEALPLHWLLVLVQPGCNMWNLKHNFSKVPGYS